MRSSAWGFWKQFHLTNEVGIALRRNTLHAFPPGFDGVFLNPADRFVRDVVDDVELDKLVSQQMQCPTSATVRWVFSLQDQSKNFVAGAMALVIGGWLVMFMARRRTTAVNKRRNNRGLRKSTSRNSRMSDAEPSQALSLGYSARFCSDPRSKNSESDAQALELLRLIHDYNEVDRVDGKPVQTSRFGRKFLMRKSFSPCLLYPVGYHLAYADGLHHYEYLDENGRSPYDEWLSSLRDARAKAKVISGVDRMEMGNLGDSEPVGEGVSELRIHYGPGYRVYYARDGQTIFLLLCGGDKSTQKKGIKRAKRLWADHKKRE